MHTPAWFSYDITNIFLKDFGFNCLQLMHYIQIHRAVGIKSYEYFFVMKFFGCVAQINDDPNPVECNVLCGIDDSREIPIIIIVFDDWTKMKMDRLEVVWIN